MTPKTLAQHNCLNHSFPMVLVIWYVDCFYHGKNISLCQETVKGPALFMFTPVFFKEILIYIFFFWIIECNFIDYFDINHLNVLIKVLSLQPKMMLRPASYMVMYDFQNTKYLINLEQDISVLFYCRYFKIRVGTIQCYAISHFLFMLVFSKCTISNFF